MWAVVFQVLAFFELVDEPIVERTVGHELKRADGVCNAFEVVALPMCKVVHRVGFPAAACAVVLLVDDAVDDGVAEVHVGVGHVNLRTQYHGALGQFTAVHFLKQSQILLYGAVAERAVNTSLRGRAFLCCNLLAGLLVDVSFAFAYQLHGKVPQLLEVV